MVKKCAVVVCEGDDLVRSGLATMLRVENFRVLAEVSETTAMKRTLSAVVGPVLIVLGSRLEQDCGPALVGELCNAFPSALVVLLVQDLSLEFRHQAEASGARAVLLWSISRESLVRSLQLVAMGEHVFSPSSNSAAGHSVAAAAGEAYQGATTAGEGGPLPDSPVEALGQSHALDEAPPSDLASSALEVPAPRAAAKRDQLSPRECDILAELVKGSPNKIIARQCNISEATVKVHLKAILRKIRVVNRTQAAIWAMNRHETPIAPSTGRLGFSASHDEPEGGPDVATW